MQIEKFFKSVIEQDLAPVVICDSAHTILYMNAAAVAQYSKFGGADLIGKSVLDCHGDKARAIICKVVEWFAADKEHNRVHTYYSARNDRDVYMVALRDEIGRLIGYYEKHEYRARDMTPFYAF